MDARQYLRDAYSNGTPLSQIAAHLGISKKAVSKRASRDPKCPPHGGFLRGGIMESEAHSQGVEAMRDPSKAELQALQQHCEAYGLPFNDTLMWWHKTQNFSVCFKSQKAIDDQKEQMAQFLNEIKRHAPKYPTVKYGRVTDGHLKLIDVADLHIGKYAIARDGTISYDAERAVSRAHDAVASLMQRTNNFPTEKFLFPVSNDVLHVDNKHNTTTKGTPQDTNLFWWQAYRAAKEMYIGVLERLVKIAPVEVIYNISNHDTHLGFTLADALESHFHKCKGITFKVDPDNDRVYVDYGKNLIGTDHGDGAKDKDLPLLMAVEAPELWAKCPNRYLFRHHLHHWSKTEYLAGKDMPGVTLQYMRSPSAPDSWHKKKGYVGQPQAIDAFVFHPEYGQQVHATCVFARN